MNSETRRKKSRSLKQLCVFAMLGVLMFVSKKIMEFLPNFHLVGMLTVAFTVVYRKKALIPIYCYILLDGLFSIFGLWWIPYLYVWLVLWGITMLLPKKMPDGAAAVIYSLTCAFHGIIFGTLYAPFEAVIRGFTLKQTFDWIILGLSFDIYHAIGNFVLGIMILPTIKILNKLEKTY